jgi:hypothetical protein
MWVGKKTIISSRFGHKFLKFDPSIGSSCRLNSS